VFAVLPFSKDRRDTLTAPDLLARSTGVFPEVCIAVRKVTINNLFGLGNRRMITVVDHRRCQTIKNRLNYI
jgi:hypothetical protein